MGSANDSTHGYRQTVIKPASWQPTEILATQHYESISQWLAPAWTSHPNYSPAHAVRSERKPVLEGLETGEVNLLIGTHALLEEEVVFENLGMVIIDEQHRFGVAQRAKLWKKNTIPPHVLVMTATPIPPYPCHDRIWRPRRICHRRVTPGTKAGTHIATVRTTVGQASTHHCDVSYNRVGKFISYILSSKRVRRAT